MSLEHNSEVKSSNLDVRVVCKNRVIAKKDTLHQFSLFSFVSPVRLHAGILPERADTGSVACHCFLLQLYAL